MRFQNAISAALTIFFLGLFGLSLTGCPFLGSGACEDEKEFSLASGVYQAIDDRENEQDGEFRYNEGADQMQVTVDKENETVEIQYTTELGTDKTETMLRHHSRERFDRASGGTTMTEWRTGKSSVSCTWGAECTIRRSAAFCARIQSSRTPSTPKT